MYSKKGFVIICLVILSALLITGCAPTTPVAVTGVTLDQAAITLTAGGATGTLVEIVAPANTTNKSVTWSSSAPAVATVDDGVVTPLTGGTTTILVATVDGGLTATCTVTVNSPAAVAIGDSYRGGIVALVMVNKIPIRMVNRIPILEKLLYSFRKPIQERGNEKKKNVPKNTSF